MKNGVIVCGCRTTFLAHMLLVVCSGLATEMPVRAATPYLVVWDSALSSAGDGSEHPLRGQFRLAPQPSIPDREVYTLEQVYLVVAGPGDARRIWRGFGLCSRGLLNDRSQRLVLELTSGAETYRFDSGPQPPDPLWPDLNFTLRTPGQPGPEIRLRAVPELARWRYRSVDGATFLNACQVCNARVFPVPLQGRFDLVHTGGNPLFERYHVLDLEFSDGAEKPGLHITGEGTLLLGGEVALQQIWSLDLRVRQGDETRLARLSNEERWAKRLWPMLAVDLAEEGGTELSRFMLSLALAPLREVWFTTRSGMTPGIGEWPGNRLSGADILSDTGRLVMSSGGLLHALELDSEPGVDGFDVIPDGRGVFVFSLSQAARSARLGEVSEGDLLTSEGRHLSRNADLLGRLGFMPPTPDLGLDAVQMVGPDEVWFSIREPAFSETLGRVVGRGDLLTSRGQVLRSNAELLARFKPLDPDRDYGLDAFYVWPSGEVWFSVEEGFQNAAPEYYTDGDLLSDQGYVVWRNLDLVRPFQPLEDLANFGLEGLLVITDTAPPAPAPKLAQPVPGRGGLVLSWGGGGRVFQIEGTERLGDPFQPLSALLPQPGWIVPWMTLTNPAGLYRLRAW